MEIYLIPAAIIIALTLLSVTFIKQGTIGVVTYFGKYQRLMQPGLNFKLPLLEMVYKRISIQNRSMELEFTAITVDQANVNFKALILFAVKNQGEDTIKKVAFKFIDDTSFVQTLIRSVEGSIRAYVASKKQNEVLQLRNEIVKEVKGHLDDSLTDWGFHLLDLQINDISFDEAIMRSMAQVVSSKNLMAAAENEGNAILITKTKTAEAEGNTIRIVAQAEKDAGLLRGQGIALFREEIAKGMAHAAKEMDEAHLDSTFMLFSIWTESLKHFAEKGDGNVIFLDGSAEGMDKTLKQIQGMNLNTNTNVHRTHK